MSELRTNRIVPRDGLPSGSVGGIIQIKSKHITDYFTTNSGTYVDVTGMSVSITPKFNTSKILVMVTLRTAMSEDDRWSAYILLRDSQILFDGTAEGSRTQCSMWHIPFVGTGTGNTFQNQNMTFLDSPSSTSALTYKLQVKVQSGATAYVNRSMNDANADYGPRTSSSITVMEVSA